MSDTITEARYVREIPMDFNGYVPVARAVAPMPAVEVRPGDILVLAGYISRVDRVRAIDLSTGRDFATIDPGLSVAEVFAKYSSGGGPQWPVRWPVLHITGDVNIIRFPHEVVSVLRAVLPPTTTEETDR